MAFHFTRGRAVVFGGQGASSLNDTWEIDAGRPLPGTPPPPGLSPREGHAMAYDASRSQLVLFGGTSGNQRLSETWLNDGAGWVPGPSAPPGPTARSDMAMAFDAARARVVLLGGRDDAGLQADTREWAFQ